MADDSPFYILDSKRLLPAADAHLWLGRIVRSYQNPAGTYTPADPAPYTAGATKKTVINDLEAAVGACHDSTLKAGLAKLAYTMSGSGKENTFAFQTSSMTCLSLENYPQVFESVSQLDEVRKYLGANLSPGGKPAYMIVGVLIWKDPTFESTSQTRQTRKIEGQLPANEIASAFVSGIPLPIDVGDPGAGISTKDETRKQIKGSMEGSYIFAVEYKAVRRKAYSLMKNFTPKLEDHGPQGKGDRVFNAEASERAAQEERDEDALTVSVDADVVWTDTLDSPDLDDSVLTETGFAGLVIAYDRSYRDDGVSGPHDT